MYEEGRSSHGSAREYHRERTSKSISSESKFTLRGAIPELVRSKSSKQPKVNDSFLKSFRRKIEVGQGVKLLTPYEVSDVCLESEYQRVRDCVNGLKTHWKELGATLMCDGWTNSLNQMHIINFLIYCSKGTIFWKSVDVSSVRSRDVEFYYNLLDSVVEEIGENYIVQIVNDNEAAMKATGKKLMLKRKHLYWTSCVAHYLDLCLEDIGKKPSVAKVLDEAKKVTCFIYNHIWTVDLMKKNTQGKQILRPALTRFATHFIQLEEITRQKQGLREMFNSKLLLFRDKYETFGTPQAQRAWKQMNPAEWWIIYGTCVPELQKLAIKVLSQTTSASNCERNWSTFSYIHTKARNRLKYKKLEKLVFTYYNMRLQIRHQKRMSTDDINVSFNPISLDHIFEYVDPLSEWLHEKENPLLDGGNAGVLPVDTSNDEMDVNQSQQQNLSHSSSSSTPSQSGDEPDGGSLSPIDEDDGYSVDKGEIRSSSQYEGEYGVGTTSGHFCDRSEFDGNMFPEPRRDRSEPRTPSKGKGKKHTSIGSSSSRRSSSSNLGYSDSSTSTQGFYPPEQPSYFQPSHGYPQPYGYYPPFPNYDVQYQPQMHPPPPMYHPPPPFIYPPPQIYPPHQLYENQGENVTFFGYIFGQKAKRIKSRTLSK
ncbi:hypothetical protein PVK06_024864 [Gossypium arboreum]|uniref:HAT C-terminal dimerisation domain-containing protein n=1 Tax=Gossypium arboreum TaxID=29729 RepID=A0ABR0PFA4_GOSAR|nr:hypothetical protein PVK06_024864 [Gossypium arboreum]